MTHDVFISYSSRDTVATEEICQGIEAAGIQCWMAPRDIIPSDDWGDSITNAINRSIVLIVIFTSHANESGHVKDEVTLADNLGKPILPFRIQDTLATGSLQLTLLRRHWLNALDRPLGPHIERLVVALKAILRGLPDRKLDQPLGRPADAASEDDILFDKNITGFPLDVIRTERSSLLRAAISSIIDSGTIRAFVRPFRERNRDRGSIRKRIWSCRNPILLRRILKNAIQRDVTPAGISSLSCFRRWTSDNNVIFRLLQEVQTIDSPKKLIKPVGVKGFYSIFPLHELAHEFLESGTLHYDSIDNSHTVALQDQDGEGTWLLILDFEIIMPSVAAPFLVFDLVETCRRCIARNPNVRGISALESVREH